MKNKADLDKIEMKVDPGDPQFYYFTEVATPGWDLRRPMRIRIGRDEEGTYIATNDQITIYGEGVDPPAAVDDFVSSLIEYYELIERVASDHAPSANYLRTIQEYITRA